MRGFGAKVPRYCRCVYLHNSLEKHTFSGIEAVFMIRKPFESEGLIIDESHPKQNRSPTTKLRKAPAKGPRPRNHPYTTPTPPKARNPIPADKKSPKPKFKAPTSQPRCRQATGIVASLSFLKVAGALTGCTWAVNPKIQNLEPYTPKPPTPP